MSYFNSTLVRLKAGRPAFNNCVRVHFNSTLVRLKDYKSKKEGPSLRNFNSTLVRLKEFQPGQSVRPSLYFNSTLVRLKDNPLIYRGKRSKFQFNSCAIKGERITDKWAWKQDFNSTLVRLKDNFQLCASDLDA